MTRYWTAVTDELLPALRAGDRMPATLRLVREIGQIVQPTTGMTLVEFEDDEAPAELEDRVVTPTIVEDATHGPTVADRHVDTTPYGIR